jgi:hypothetical protein
MPFCPKCRFEYQPEIKLCPDCKESLVAQLLPLEKEKVEDVQYVPLRKVPSRIYAEMLQEALEKQDIPCLLKGDDIGVFLGALGTTSVLPVTVWVPKELKEKAEEIAFQILGEI